MRSFAVLAVLAATGAAQSSVPSYKSSLDMKIDPNTVEIQTRASWCNGETDTCNLLCGDETNDNSCLAETLEYKCTCSSNSSVPGLQFYTQTMPTYICNELFGQCNAQHTSSARDQDACKKNIFDLCGTTNPPKNAIQPSGSSSDDSDSTSGSATTPTSSSAKSTGSSASATGDVKSSSKSGGFAAPTMAPMGHGMAAAAAVGALAVLI